MRYDSNESPQQNSVEEFNNIVARRNIRWNEDPKNTELTIVRNLITFKTFNTTGRGVHGATSRYDVNTKKMLRQCRLFYDHKLEDSFQVKRTRRKISRSVARTWKKERSFIEYTDELVP